MDRTKQDCIGTGRLSFNSDRNFGLHRIWMGVMIFNYLFLAPLFATDELNKSEPTDREIFSDTADIESFDVAPAGDFLVVLSNLEIKGVRTNGEIFFRYPAGSKSTPRHPFFIGCPEVSDGGESIVSKENKEMVVLSAIGEELWKSPNWYCGRLPIFSDGTLCLASNSETISNYEIRTGKLSWKANTGVSTIGELDGSPSGTIAVRGLDGVTVFDKKGVRVWQDLKKPRFDSTVRVLDSCFLYCTKDELHCVSSSGIRLWDRTLASNQMFLGAESVEKNGEIRILTSNSVDAVDTKTGKTLWSFRGPEFNKHTCIVTSKGNYTYLLPANAHDKLSVLDPKGKVVYRSSRDVISSRYLQRGKDDRIYFLDRIVNKGVFVRSVVVELNFQGVFAK